MRCQNIKNVSQASDKKKHMKKTEVPLKINKGRTEKKI